MADNFLVDLPHPRTLDMKTQSVRRIHAPDLSPARHGIAMPDYDGIIIGAGHNALILQAYLGKAGLKDALRSSAGTCGRRLSTVEDPRHPGFLHNTHAFFQRAITTMPWYADLELERHGAHYIEPELNVALLTATAARSNGGPTSSGRSRRSRSSAGATPSLAALAARVRADRARHPAAGEPSVPLPPDERRACSNAALRAAACWRSARCRRSNSCMQEFEHPTVQAGCCSSTACARSTCACAASAITSRRCSRARQGADVARRQRGARARARGRGARERRRDPLMTEPARIVVENGRAVGVETRTAKSSAHASSPPRSIRRRRSSTCWTSARAARDPRAVERFQYNLLAPLFALHLNLREPPRYRQRRTSRAGAALHGDHGARSRRSVPDIVRHHEAGTIPPTVMWGACPTLFDPSQAPPGRHTRFMWEKLPYRLHGDAANWDSARDAHGAEMLTLWRQHAPNLADAVIDSFTRSPLDVERCLPNMREGDLLVGASPTTRSDTIARSAAPATTARTLRSSICADRAAIPAAT
jgi:phytoene dehydrogenase-like protein